MKTALECPDIKDLGRLALGQVSDEELIALERHLGECPRCGDTLAQVRVSDTLMDAVQAQAHATPLPELDIVAGMIDRLRALMPAGDSTARGEGAGDEAS